jgi:hypothetical protein
MSARLKTINAEEAVYEGFRQLAKECELTSPELVAAMVQYFRVTKADPRHPTGPDLTTSLAKLTAKLADLDKRTIGFIREQEKTYLKPILAEVQAHKVLSTPAVSAPVGLSEGQVQELSYWLERVFFKSLQPIVLAPAFVERVPKSNVTPSQADPQLAPVQRAIIAVLKAALKPEVVTAILNPPPKTTPGATPAPATVPVSPPSNPA